VLCQACSIPGADQQLVTYNMPDTESHVLRHTALLWVHTG
jgi:hypothetical protein